MDFMLKCKQTVIIYNFNWHLESQEGCALQGYFVGFILLVAANSALIINSELFYILSVHVTMCHLERNNTHFCKGIFAYS